MPSRSDFSPVCSPIHPPQPFVLVVYVPVAFDIAESDFYAFGTAEADIYVTLQVRFAVCVFVCVCVCMCVCA